MIRFHLRRVVITLPLIFLGIYTLLAIRQNVYEEDFSWRFKDQQGPSWIDPKCKIIVLTYNRSQSLQKCLEALQRLELDGAQCSVEIWIDRSVKGSIDREVLRTANDFFWKHGRSSVQIQQRHVGIYGQWISTWSPVDDREIGIILEDDIDLSPHAFRWLNAAQGRYDKQKDIAGYALSDIEIPLDRNDRYLQPSKDEVAFLFPRFSTFGFSPKASVWRDFQQWYTQRTNTKKFKPYTLSDSLFTRWFKIFEKQNRTSSMWSIWFIKYCSEHKLYTLYPNTFQYLTHRYPDLKNRTSLSFHRREQGLHFYDSQGRSSEECLLRTWFPELANFPSTLVTYTIPPPSVFNRKVMRRLVKKKESHFAAKPHVE